MKSIYHYNTARDKVLHIEAEGCIVNIRVGLTNSAGKNVTVVEILPDRDWEFDIGESLNRLIKKES